jgi:hypothetical protein
MTLFQFADDTAIITPAHPMNLKIIMLTLKTFAQASGLENNHAKSEFLLIVIPRDLMPTLTSILK